MSCPKSTRYLTEIQTLSLLPDKKIGSWSSEARKALQVGLRTTASHPKCDGIHWLQKIEDPQKIVVISKWTDTVDFTTSRSYLRPLLPHLESPPTRSIHVNNASHSFSNYTISNFLTVYFPIRYCTAKFKSQITANVTSFITATEPTYDSPESLRFVASGWIKETKMMNGEVASGFMFCLMWTDRKSEDWYKSQNEHWRVLMRYLKGMGMLGEEQYHGKAFQVLGERQKERFEFSDDSSDDDDDDMDEQIELMRERLKKLAPNCTPELRGSDAKSESDVTRHWNRLDIFGGPKGRGQSVEDDSSTDAWFDCSVAKTAAEGTDSESADSTPVLTPSSSTMSLNSLFDDSKSMSELPGTWKSDYDISHPHGVGDHNSISDPCQNHHEDESAQPILPKGEYCYESCNDGDEEENDIGLDIGLEALEKVSTRLKALSTTSAASPIQQDSPAAAKLQGILSLKSPSRTDIIDHDEKAIPELMHRYGVAKWDPEEELRNAKSRFWQRRRRLPAPQLETQRAILRVRSPPAERGRPVERVLSIDPLRNSGPENKRKGSWWTYVRDCLPNPAAGSRASADVEAGVDVESVQEGDRTAVDE